MASIKELIQSIESGDSSFDEKLAAINQMEETLIAMRNNEEQAVNDNVELIVEAIKVMEKKVNDQLEIAKSIVPEKGDKGDRGIDGAPGRDGANGRDGRDGKDGQNGQDGADGVSVTDAKIDFDGSLIITLSTGREINVGEVVASDLAEKIKVISTMSTNTAIADITGGTIDNTVIGGTTPAAGTFTTLTATGQTSLGGTTTTDVVRIYRNNTITSDTASFTAPALSFIPPQAGFGAGILRSSAQLNISTGTTNPIVLQTASTLGFSGTTQAQVSHTASAVNYVQVTGSATLTGAPTLSAQGSDFNIPLRLQSKGIGGVELGNPAGWAGFTVTTTNNPNRIALNAPATGLIPTFSTAGVDTNAGMAFISKGTGAIDLAAGSSGVNISNGGTVTALTRTTSAFNYTSQPTLAISAPTTAGGVQATAVQHMYINTAPVTSGGTGYTVGNVLTVVGGTPVTTAATLTVSTVSAGVITGVTSTNFNSYSALPSSPVSVTGGTGSGATFSPNWGNANSFTITNAGSGYVEQPTVSFSGGGGSGAAAYATVGSSTVIKTLGSTATTSGISFQTPAGEQVRITDSGNTAVNYIGMWGGSSGVAPRFVARGTDTDVSLLYSVKGAGNHVFRTNDANQTQFQVSHTASAVNYVQVTGAATGGGTVISAQGSDSNVEFITRPKGNANNTLQDGNSTAGLQVIARAASGDSFLTVQRDVSVVNLGVGGGATNADIRLTPKGTGAVRDVTGGGEQLRVSNTASAVNYVNITGAATGNPGVCFISAQGSDTNISLASVNKGTGAFSWFNGGSTGSRLFRVNGGATNMANHLQIDAAAAGSFPSLSVGSLSADTNVDLALTPKGTGNVRFGTYTGTISAITGYIEIKDSGGTVRRLAVVA